MQAVVLLLLGVSLCGVCGSEERADPDTLSIIRAIKALQTKVQTMETSLVQVQNQIQTLETSQVQVQLQNTPCVAFLAGFQLSDGTGRYGPFDTDTTIKYTNVLTNIGDGYNYETGLFTAPLRGLYVFHYTVHSSTGSSAHSTDSRTSYVRLKKNTEVFVETFDSVSDQDKYDSASNVAVVTLEQGDTVSVELQSGNNFSDAHGGQTNFSGFLLSPMAPPPQ